MARIHVTGGCGTIGRHVAGEWLEHGYAARRLDGLLDRLADQGQSWRRTLPRRHCRLTPTIRLFEALGCGIPLLPAPWNDPENLFRPRTEVLLVPDGEAMTHALRDLLADPARAAELARNGLDTMRSRHTCRHRVTELFDTLGRLHAGRTVQLQKAY